MKRIRFTLHSTFATCLVGLFALALAEGSGAAGIGVSPVGAQRFGNEDLLIFIPEEGDRFAWSLATGDFNGDGADDLASGMPYDDGFGVPDSGLVVVRYGIPGSGLEAGIAENALSQFFGGTPDPDEEMDLFGWALAACDFNGDGFDDLAVGAPGETYLGHSWAGAVQVHYGAPVGLDGAGDEFYTQASEGVPGDVEEHDKFGRALSCGDFDADGFADLAIGVPHETLSAIFDIQLAGMIAILPGSAVGLDSAAATGLDQDSPGMDGEAEYQDFFGEALTTGDFDGDGYADLAIGVPGEYFNEISHGAVHVVYGGASGLTSAGDFLFSENLFSSGSPDWGDGFGSSLAAGDFDDDGYADLAVGIPFRDRPPVGGVDREDCGAVGEMFGSASGLGPARGLIIDQDGLPGDAANESNDRFGYALAAGDFDRDGIADLAIGHPGEDVLGDYSGSATVLMGFAGWGLGANSNRTFAAGLEGVPGNQLEWYQDFGTSLAVGDFDGDGHDDLAIGAPWDNEYGLHDIGTVTVLRGALFADGFECESSLYWSNSVP